MCLGLSAFGALASPPPNDQELKASLVVNFIQFSSWPRPTAADFNLCLVGVTLIEPALNSLTGIPVHGTRPLRVKRIKAAEGLGDCHAVYLEERSRADAERIVGALGNATVLTMTDAAGLADRGWMIELVRIGSRWGFDINWSAVQRARIGMSSNLLRLARDLGPSTRDE